MTLLAETLSVLEFSFLRTLLKFIVIKAAPKVLKEVVNQILASEHLKVPVPTRLIIALVVVSIKIPCKARNIFNDLLINHFLSSYDHA